MRQVTGPCFCDLAALYGVETKVLNQAVKRNIKRFEGDDFMFRLTKDETAFVHSKSQIVTLNSLEVDGGDSLRSQIVTTKEMPQGQVSGICEALF